MLRRFEMKWFSNISIMVKLLLGFTGVALIAALVGGIGVYNIKAIDAADITLYEKATIPLSDINDVSTHLQKVRIYIRDYFASRDDQSRARNEKKIAASKNEIDSYMIDFEKTILTEDGRKSFQELKADFDAYYRVLERTTSMAKKGDIANASAQYLDEGSPIVARIDDAVTRLVDMKKGIAKNISDENTAMANRTVLMMCVVIVCAFFISILIGFAIARGIQGPVEKGLAFAQKIAAGDFTERINLDQKDELGQLGKALNTAADDLEKMVADIIVGSQNLVQAIQEISAGNENLSQRTSEQASSLEEVASTIEETAASINQNAENAKNANSLSVKTSSLAEEGGQVVYDAVNAINEINEASKKIEEIISVINEIAFQTNLLALNAAVEAARAGEQGRGFAVVAGEVRNLAQRSGSAAKEIGELIKTTIVKVEKGTALSNRSGEALREIIMSVKTVNKLISEIDASSEEQKQGSAQINIAVSELDAMTQQNAGLVEETASASEEIANQAQDLLGTMERFRIRDGIRTASQSEKHKELHLNSSSKKTVGPLSVKRSIKKDAAAPKHELSGENKIEKILSAEGFEQF